MIVFPLAVDSTYQKKENAVKPNATSLFALPDLRSLRFHMAWEAGLFIARLPDAPGSGKMFRLFRW